MNGRTAVAAALAAAIGFAAAATAAEQKIAVLDFDRVLKEYYKTKPAEEELDRQKAEYKSEIEKMAKKLDGMQEAYEAAREEARNKALNDEALKAKLAAAEKKLTELKEFDQETRKFADREKRRMFEDTMRMRKRFSEEIQETVRKYAVEKGFTLVLDSGSAIAELRGAVVYRQDTMDITDAILALLNADKAAKPAKAETKP